eukprot:scaffold18281_cov78-Phaeocystis_antarctica.AAC.2
MGSGSPMSPNIVLNGTPPSLSVFAVATSDASLKSTPTISSGRFSRCLPRHVRSRTYSYSRSSSVPSPHPVSATIDGCWSRGSSSKVWCTCTLIMSSKNLPCMKPEPITFIVRSTCASCPSPSCVNTSATSPNSTVSSCRSIGRYESATPNAPHRCTTKRPLSVNCRPPSLSPATHMPRRRNEAASSSNVALSRPLRCTLPPGAVSMWCMCSSSSSGASTAPVSIVRSAAGAESSSGNSAQPSSASRSCAASRATIPGASEYTASHSVLSDLQHAAASVVGGAAYAPASLSVAQPRARSVRSATCRWPAFAPVATTSASKVWGTASTSSARRLARSVAAAT